jgi:uncharacterized protein YciI
MFITLLKLTANRAAAPRFMAAHNEWIAKGFADGVFLCVGSLTPEGGGAILAHEESREDHQTRIAADPFVMHGIVTAEMHEVDPKQTIEALKFLKASA